MDLPPAASAMMRDWWTFATHAASALSPDGSFAFTVTDASSAASQINQNVFGGQGGYNPIGLSQLFGIARSAAKAGAALSSADSSSAILPGMIAEAPWSRTPEEQLAMPMWQVRAQVSYLDPEGTPVDGIFTISVPQVLPSSVGSLQQFVDLRVTDMLASGPGTGTPRAGSLVSATPSAILAI